MASSSSHQPLGQLAALHLAYERIVPLAIAMPCASVLVPLTVRATGVAVSVVSDNHVGVALFLFLFLFGAGLPLIKSLTKTERGFRVAMDIHLRRAPILLFLTSLCSRLCGGFLHGPDNLSITTFFQSVRLSLVTLVLSLVVFLRFVGPISTLRCSTTPLRPSRTEGVRESFLRLLRPPGPVPYGRTSQDSPFLRTERLPLSIAILQLVPIFVGASIATPFLDPVSFCICAAIMYYCLHMGNHEIDPSRLGSFSDVMLNACRLVARALFVLVFLLTAITYTTQYKTQYLASLFLNGALVSIYLQTLNALGLYLLFSPCHRLKPRAAELMYDGTDRPLLILAVQGLLRCGYTVSDPIINDKGMDSGNYEWELSQRFSSMLFASRPGYPLEEDMLQLIIMNYLGSSNETTIGALLPMIRSVCTYLIHVESLLRNHPRLAIPPGMRVMVSKALDFVSSRFKTSPYLSIETLRVFRRSLPAWELVLAKQCDDAARLIVSQLGNKFIDRKETLDWIGQLRDS